MAVGASKASQPVSVTLSFRVGERPCPKSKVENRGSLPSSTSGLHVCPHRRAYPHMYAHTQHTDKKKLCRSRECQGFYSNNTPPVTACNAPPALVQFLLSCRFPNRPVCRVLCFMNRRERAPQHTPGVEAAPHWYNQLENIP